MCGSNQSTAVVAMAVNHSCRLSVTAVAQLLFLAIYCVVASSFLLPSRSASARRNLANPVAQTAPSCSSTSSRCSRSRRGDSRSRVSNAGRNDRRARPPPPSSPSAAVFTRPIPSTAAASPRMLNDDINAGEQQLEGEDEVRQQVGTDITTRKRSTITHKSGASNDNENGSSSSNNDDDDGGGGEENAPRPKTFGDGRYLVRGVLGTGSTASTYRCTTVSTPPETTAASPPTPPPGQQAQEQREEGVIKERQA